VEPPPERAPGQAGLPVSDAAISGPHLQAPAASRRIVQAAVPHFKLCYQGFKLRRKIGF
jgi:hypothetical protein